MHVEALWRYPVKSLAGERLRRADVTVDGIAGDRLVLVHDGRRVVTSRTRPRLLALRGGLDPAGRALVNGRLWDTPEATAAVRAAVGPDAGLVAHDGPERFDVLPLLVATDGAIDAFGRDARRLRPNLVLGGVPGLQEREWEGRRLRIGDVVIALESLRARCVMTTYHPDTLEQDLDVLRDIRRRFGGRLALNAAVEVPGVISVGDHAELA